MPDENEEFDPAAPRDRGLHRHGDPDPSQWDEQKAVTGRPNDEFGENSTLASRAKDGVVKAEKLNVEDTKQVDKDEEAVEDKAVKKSESKKKPARKRRA